MVDIGENCFAQKMRQHCSTSQTAFQADSQPLCVLPTLQQRHMGSSQQQAHVVMSEEVTFGHKLAADSNAYLSQAHDCSSLGICDGSSKAGSACSS